MLGRKAWTRTATAFIALGSRWRISKRQLPRFRRKGSRFCSEAATIQRRHLRLPRLPRQTRRDHRTAAQRYEVAPSIRTGAPQLDQCARRARPELLVAARRFRNRGRARGTWAIPVLAMRGVAPGRIGAIGLGYGPLVERIGRMVM